jgi:hypothetical protein
MVWRIVYGSGCGLILGAVQNVNGGTKDNYEKHTGITALRFETRDALMKK